MIRAVKIASALLAAWGVLGVTPALAAVDPVSEGQWFHAFLNIAEAHTVTQGAGITVAVLDSGVDASHPDLAGSVLRGDSHVTAPGDSFNDNDGHGTAMAGLIVAHGTVKGIAPQAKVLAIRVMITGDFSGGKSGDVAHGIRSAINGGAKVISLSLGGGVRGGIMQEAVEEAIAADIVVVASAGNLPDATKVEYPAAYPGVVAVAGVGKNGSRSAISATGPEVVIAAPSDMISSTKAGGGHRIGTGTSDSTAIVAGAVALIRSKYPQLKATEVIRRLTATAIDKGAAGRDNEYGYGVLNIVGALTASLPPETPATPSGSAPPRSTNDGFPWWLLAIPAVLGVLGVIGAGLAIAIIRAKRR